MKNKGILRISGYVEVDITDKLGNKRRVWEGKNTIDHDFYEVLTRHFHDNTDMALDNLFPSDAFSPSDYYDGIISDVYEAAFPYSYQGVINYACTSSQPATDQFRIVGTYTSNYGASHRIYGAKMGKSYIGSYNAGGQSIGAFQDFDVSVAGFSGGLVVLPDGETLTVTWTITFTNH